MRALLRWLTGQWVDAATTCHPASTYARDLAGDTLSVTVCRAGEFALFGQRQTAIYLPVMPISRN